MKTLLHLCYFGSIANYTAMIKAEKVIFEVNDNYQKQTLRNRTYIYGANGKLSLNLSILHTKDGLKQAYRDIKIEHQFNTLKTHWKSLESAYRTSPYFEFYEDDLAPLFEKKPEFLMDFNFECQEVLLDCLQLDLNSSKTVSFNLETDDTIDDYRKFVSAKNNSIGQEFSKYNQVFENKYGFIHNLSILDLLFNEGPNATTYLEEQANLI